MTKLNKQGKQAAIIAAVLIALAVTCCMLGNNGFYPKTLWLVRSGIYIFLIVAWGVLIVLIFESCIGCGLIQSNSYYTELFQASTFAAQSHCGVYLSRRSDEREQRVLACHPDHSLRPQTLALHRPPRDP